MSGFRPQVRVSDTMIIVVVTDTKKGTFCVIVLFIDKNYLKWLDQDYLVVI